MTEKEVKIMQDLGECWNQFLSLPEKHPSDKQDFMFHIHALQNIILARVGLNMYNILVEKISKELP
jgi:hypothetical protein